MVTEVLVLTISDSRSACLNFDVDVACCPKFSKHKPFIAYDSASIFKLRLEMCENNKINSFGRITTLLVVATYSVSSFSESEFNSAFEKFSKLSSYKPHAYNILASNK